MMAAKKETWSDKRHREANAEVSRVMSRKGFQSVFEHINKTDIFGQAVWTLWWNLKTGAQILTHVDRDGCISYQKVSDLFGFADEA